MSELPAVAIKSKLSTAAKATKTVAKKAVSKVKSTVKKVPKSLCFVAGTLVETQGGHIPIENIKAGDYVYAENPETGEKGLKRVVQTFENETNELVHVKVDGQKISTTPKHPFYSPEKGWVDAIELRAGDRLVLRSGEIVIVQLVQHEILETPVMVYNFEVEDFHTYYVTSSSVLVHNMCPKAKMLPKNARTTNSFRTISQRLSKYHGVSEKLASLRLHAIKKSLGMGGADNVIFDLTGNVYNKLGQWIGTLTK